jgi:hypothetical protein
MDAVGIGVGRRDGFEALRAWGFVGEV